MLPTTNHQEPKKMVCGTYLPAKAYTDHDSVKRVLETHIFFFHFNSMNKYLLSGKNLCDSEILFIYCFIVDYGFFDRSEDHFVIYYPGHHVVFAS